MRHTVYEVLPLSRGQQVSQKDWPTLHPRKGITYDCYRRYLREQPGGCHPRSAELLGDQPRRCPLERGLRAPSYGLLLGSRELGPERQHLQEGPRRRLRRCGRPARPDRRGALLRRAARSFTQGLQAQAEAACSASRQQRPRRPHLLIQYQERKS